MKIITPKNVHSQRGVQNLGICCAMQRRSSYNDVSLGLMNCSGEMAEWWLILCGFLTDSNFFRHQLIKIEHQSFQLPRRTQPLASQASTLYGGPRLMRRPFKLNTSLKFIGMVLATRRLKGPWNHMGSMKFRCRQGEISVLALALQQARGLSSPKTPDIPWWKLFPGGFRRFDTFLPWSWCTVLTLLG